MKKFMFFYGGKLSNWYPCKFVVDDIEYINSEQYMMYQKAICFKDEETAKEILESKSPAVQKTLGRKVKNFDPKVWDSVKYDLVKKGLREKFLQNPDLKKYLLDHKGYQMVEASPEDRIWGIGYKSSDALSNMRHWGENLLGKILTELSQEIE